MSGSCFHHLFFSPSMCSGMVETELGPSEVLRLKDDAVR